jgi:Zn-finger nucleic acid-binding protein
MKNQRSLRVTCPACEIDYRLQDETLLPIARCGRCYGAVVTEGAIRDVEYGEVMAPAAKAA